MTAIDLLLLVAIILVLVTLSAGGYVLMFRKRSFFKRPYRIHVSDAGDCNQGSEARGRMSEKDVDTATGGIDVAGDFPAEHEPSTAQPLAVSAVIPKSATEAMEFAGMEIAGEFQAEHEPLTSYEGAEYQPSTATPGVPLSYGDCKITALVRDPYWLFTYWEINDTKREEIARRYGHQAWNESWPVLRVYDTTNLYFFDSRHFAEITINDYASNWYICTGQPNKTFCIELGRVRPDGSYIFLARSNFVSAPRDQISDVIDVEWLLLPEYTAQLYRQIGGSYSGPSSPGLMGLGPAEYISSPGLMGPGGEVSSPMKWQ
jgi:hypothetical protein